MACVLADFVVVVQFRLMGILSLSLPYALNEKSFIAVLRKLHFTVKPPGERAETSHRLTQRSPEVLEKERKTRRYISYVYAESKDSS